LSFGFARNPIVDAREELRIACAQILVRDPERSRQQREGELNRLERHVSLGVLEPLQRRLCGALKALHLRAPSRLVRPQRGRDVVRVFMKRIAQRDRVFHGHPRPGADGEMRGVRRVADEHDVATEPRIAPDGRELPPDAAVRDERVAVELLGEKAFEKCGGLLLVRAIHSRGLPRVLTTLDDERRAIRAVLIGMHAPETVIVVLEIKRERRKRFARAKPHEPIRPLIDRRVDAILKQPAHRTVGPVGGDDEIGITEIVERRDFTFEAQIDAGCTRLLLQYAQQRVPAHAAEAVTGRRDALAAIVHVDVVPMHEVARDAAVRLRVRIGDARHRRVGEHDTESERIVRAIAFDDANLMAWIRFLHQHGEVQSAGAAADADDAHHRNFGGRFATNASYASRKSA
jgi:hypothetical protein